MEYHANQEVLRFSTIPLEKEGSYITSFNENSVKDRSVKYLRFWGDDYPYLDGSKNCVDRCLPIPEDSKAQRLIRNMT